MADWQGTFRDRVLREALGGRLLLPPWIASTTTLGVMADTVRPPTDNEDERDDWSVMRALAQILAGVSVAEAFLADNVAEYFYAGTSQEHWGVDDFPCVAPPFEVFWIEWGRPSRVVSEEYGEVSVLDTAPAHVGWFFTAQSLDDEPGWRLVGTMFMEADSRDTGFAAVGEGIFWSTLNLDARLAEDGSIKELGKPGVWYDPDLFDRLAVGQTGLSMVAASLGSLLWPALLTLTFANCRNVPRERVEPPAKLVKRDVKRGRVPHASYHLLDIGPMQHTLGVEGGVASHGSVQRALHVCRGHFKSYNEDAPLFGRVTGTWWWGPQLRGSSDAGVVEKDYRLRGD